jgi:topoisomerase-4 subunit A
VALGFARAHLHRGAHLPSHREIEDLGKRPRGDPRGLKPFLRQLRREVTDDDITRLTEIRIKRISAYNRFQADEAIKKIEEGIKETKATSRSSPSMPSPGSRCSRRNTARAQAPHQLRRDRTDRRIAVVSANQRLYVNREDGFIGLNWRQHEFVTECTILDSVLTIMRDGSLKVTKVADKVFMGRDIIHVAIWPKDGDTRSTRWSTATAPKESASPRNSRSAASPATSCTPRQNRRLQTRLAGRRRRRKRTCPRASTVSLDGRSGARVRELDFDLTPVPVSTRTSKGLLVTKWAIKEVKVNDLSLK